MKYMMHSLKPTLFTFLPIILIIGWMNAHYAFSPIQPGESFSVYAVMDDVTLQYADISLPENMRLLSSERSEIIRLDKNDNPDNLPFENKQITSKRSGGFIEPETDVYYAKWDLSANSGVHTIEIIINNQTYGKEVTVSAKTYGKAIDVIDDGKVRGIFIDRGKLVVLNLFGWKLGWLGAYIIFSLIFSMSLRKVLKIH